MSTVNEPLAVPDFKTARALPAQGEATIVSVTPSGMLRQQADGYRDDDTERLPLVRSYHVVYRYEMRLFNLTVAERRGVGFLQVLKSAVRRDVEDRRYTDDPLDAVRDKLPVTFEV